MAEAKKAFIPEMSLWRYVCSQPDHTGGRGPHLHRTLKMHTDGGQDRIGT